MFLSNFLGQDKCCFWANTSHSYKIEITPLFKLQSTSYSTFLETVPFQTYLSSQSFLYASIFFSKLIIKYCNFKYSFCRVLSVICCPLLLQGPASISNLIKRTMLFHLHASKIRERSLSKILQLSTL